VPESSRRTDAPRSRALRLARSALASTPAGLLTDFDGTLSPIVVEPAAARPARGVEQALRGLLGRLAVVAVITGRAPIDARRRLGLDGVLVVGNHGAEWLEPDAAEPTPVPGADRARVAVATALRRAGTVPDASVEAKGLSATVHYRAARDPEAARSAILEALDSLPPEIALREGRMSVELRPAGFGDKGSAARAVIDRYALRGVLVLGDDVTDIDMFSTVASLRREGTLSAAIVGVGGGAEMPTDVSAAADVVLRDPDEVVSLLADLAATVRR
jgi:trehalose 6-phosphate phosphatase